MQHSQIRRLSADRYPPRALAVLLAVIGFMTSACAILWLCHDARDYELHAVARAISNGEPVSNEALARAVITGVTLERAGDASSLDLSDAGLTTTYLAQRNNASPQMLAPLLATDERFLHERLAKAPADGYSWLRLAIVHNARVGVDPLTDRALMMSWLVTSREISVMWPGLKFRIALWNKLSVEQHREAADLVVGIWHKPPDRDALRHYVLSLWPETRISLLSLVADPQVYAALRT